MLYMVNLYCALFSHFLVNVKNQFSTKNLINFLASILPLKFYIIVSESRPTRNSFFTDFCFLYSLTCPLYHCANNSVFTIGYLFMCGVTYLWRRDLVVSSNC